MGARLAPLHPCPHPGCPHLYRAANDCPDHSRKPWATTTTSAHQRGYGTHWRKTRARVLRLEPGCRTCGQPATCVDHIVPKHLGGDNDIANLQPLCDKCHTAKTVTEATTARKTLPPRLKGWGTTPELPDR